MDSPNKHRAFFPDHTPDQKRASWTAAPAEFVHRGVNELRPNPRNARTHQKRKIRDLAKEIEALGFIGAIITDETGMILAGHARHAAAKLLGFHSVPTIIAAGLSDAKKRAFVLADNKFSERAGYDREILINELKELSLVQPGRANLARRPAWRRRSLTCPLPAES